MNGIEHMTAMEQPVEHWTYTSHDRHDGHDRNEQPTASGLPDFEGEPVDHARLKLTGAGNLQGPDFPYRVDQVVKLVIEGRVTRVEHIVDNASGKLKRVQTISIIDVRDVPDSFDVEGLFE